MVINQEQANKLNSSHEYGPYHAANGHTMVAPLELPRDWDAPCHNCGGSGTTDNGEYVCGFCKGRGNGAERAYRVGDNIKYRSFAASCVEGCAACCEGDPLPDW